MKVIELHTAHSDFVPLLVARKATVPHSPGPEMSDRRAVSAAARPARACYRASSFSPLVGVPAGAASRSGGQQRAVSESSRQPPGMTHVRKQVIEWVARTVCSSRRDKRSSTPIARSLVAVLLLLLLLYCLRHYIRAAAALREDEDPATRAGRCFDTAARWLPLPSSPPRNSRSASSSCCRASSSSRRARSRNARYSPSGCRSFATMSIACNALDVPSSTASRGGLGGATLRNFLTCCGASGRVSKHSVATVNDSLWSTGSVVSRCLQPMCMHATVSPW